LDTRPICGAGHESAKSIDLAHDCAFGHATDCRVAAQLPDPGEVRCDQQRSSAEAGGRGRRFAAGVSTADYDHIMSRFRHPEPRL
jgi:hypothetical protein